GRDFSEEHRAKISLALKGKMLGSHLSKEHKAKISLAMEGKHHTEETKTKIRQGNTGKHLSEEAKAKLRLANTGKHPTEETKTKLRLSHLGEKHSPERKENNRQTQLRLKRKLTPEQRQAISERMIGNKYATGSQFFLGRHHTERAKRKISEAHKGIPFSKEKRLHISQAKKGKCMGPEATNWKGGKSFEPYPYHFNKELKEEIRARDNYTCQLCEAKQNGTGFCIHHIDYTKNNNTPSNLITLCPVCNSLANFNRQSWTSYFQLLLYSRYFSEL
ncbi:unnamed protein product, partial [marine sediment metagenome]